MAKVLMKGNEAIAEAAILAGCRFFFGYPITPQNQIPEYMSKRMPKVGGCFLQAESEVSAINMVYGASGAGARVMTSSSSPGISLKQEGISYAVGAELPLVVVNMVRGGPGLGKTFLSACIAREVSARGFSVAYESAPAALGEFETQRFSRDPEEAGAAAAKVREYLNCDLMILDDLGTEMTTSFTVSALYQLVNTRLTESRQTIISTNLDDGEILRRYGGQVASRLSGEFELLSFAGSDIRRLRKEQSL